MSDLTSLRTRFASIEAPPEESAWQEHIPFGKVLIELLSPRLLVELGVHTGASYLAFCEAVSELGLSCSCSGIDTFQGDEHAGQYGNEVEARLRARHDPRYGHFSRLITSTFDEAVSHFEDGSVDLLHIDGMHSYEAVCHDFETWKRTLSSRAVVLFHDTNVRERGFGVWRLWDELRARHPHFTFQHGHGLGVLGIGPDQAETMRALFELSESQTELVNDVFFALGQRVTLQVRLADEVTRHRRFAETHPVPREELDLALGRYAALERELHDLRQRHDQAVRTLSGELEKARGDMHRLVQSISFRLGMGATAPLRWVFSRFSEPPSRP